MKLSVVIVNYNVRYFIEQTLRSVFESETKFDFEVYVVDNASSDGSVEMIKEKFPDVHLISSKENLGFSGGNNLALRKVKSEYVLLLNPDTIVSEDTFQICVDKMDGQKNIGGLGVRMIDGSGEFLPESKRGLPTPWVAFCKAFGLSKLFPKSQLFNKYHLGHIDEMQEAEIDVLSGAFMLMRMSVLNEVGLLDEDFFMYGEDIDLSYRIQKGGYVNYYLPTTSIVHFKGESTKKGSLNYVRIFYKAMIIFAKKHFVGSGAFFIALIYQLAVLLRASMSLVGGFMRFITPIVIDAGIILAGLRLMTFFWANFYFREADYFSSVPYLWHHALYTCFWIFSLFIGGAYDEYYNLTRLRKSLILGTLFLLVCFSLMSSDWRPSRAVLLLGAAWTLVTLSLIRWLTGKMTGASISEVRLAIVGSRSEIERSIRLMEESRYNYEEAIWVHPSEKDESGYKGSLHDLSDIAEAYRLDEVVFCAKDVDHGEIIQWMTHFSKDKIVRIIPEESSSIIASRYKNKKGELYAIDARLNIAQPIYRRQKRVFDILVAMGGILLSPLLVFSGKGRRIVGSIVPVLLGRKTWLGYAPNAGVKYQLPTIRPSIWDVAEGLEDPKLKEKVCYLYARDYSIWADSGVVFGKILG